MTADPFINGKPCCDDHATAEDDRAPGEVYDYDGIDMTGHEWAVRRNNEIEAGNRRWREGQA